MEMKCKTCGRALKTEDEGIIWRRCEICKTPVCFNDIHYMGTKVKGLYKDYIMVIPVCEDELKRKK
jgi:hypothetical protein